MAFCAHRSKGIPEFSCTYPIPSFHMWLIGGRPLCGTMFSFFYRPARSCQFNERTSFRQREMRVAMRCCQGYGASSLSKPWLRKTLMAHTSVSCAPLVPYSQRPLVALGTHRINVHAPVNPTIAPRMRGGQPHLQHDVCLCRMDALARDLPLPQCAFEGKGGATGPGRKSPTRACTYACACTCKALPLTKFYSIL